MGIRESTAVVCRNGGDRGVHGDEVESGDGVSGAGGTATGVGGIVAGEGHVCSIALGDEACVGGGRGRATHRLMELSREATP